jgi:hypothetical protein
LPAEQSVSAAQVTGQDFEPPAQRYGAQTGAPTLPGGSAVQTPSAVAPAEAEQTLQPAEQVSLQQVPFAQRPVEH